MQSTGITLNKEKCKFRNETIKFLGYIINSEGISSDPQKTAAIKDMKGPSSVLEL